MFGHVLDKPTFDAKMTCCFAVSAEAQIALTLYYLIRNYPIDRQVVRIVDGLPL